MPSADPSARSAGLSAGLAAYLLWGVFPIYWKLLERVPAEELLAHRVLWSAVLLVGALVARGRGGELVRALSTPRAAWALVASASLITVNFYTFIWGVNHGRVTEVSLGYYVNPVLNVLLGFAVLRERLTRLQGVAVALAIAGVVNLAVARGAAPWVSLVLAGAFALYGLVRKTAPVEAMTGLAVETLLLAPLALAALLLLPPAPFGALASGGAAQTLTVLASGPVTAGPLFLFAYAARRVDYGVLGMLQYIAPTMQLALAVLVYREPFTRAHAVTFALVWSAMALYLYESARVAAAARARARPAAAG